MRRLMLGMLLFIVVFPASAEPLRDLAGTRDLCSSSADAFAEGNPKLSVEILKPYWPLPDEELANLAYQTQSQLRTVAGRFGTPLEAEYLDTSKAGNSLVRHRFVVKFEKHAVRYFCVFYNPGDQWVVNALYWDDDTMRLFD